MAINVAYFGFEVSDLDAWQRYGDLIGLSVVRSDEGVFFKMDGKAHRIHCVNGPSDDIAWLGWEADSEQAYAHLREHIEAKRFSTRDGDSGSARLRGVERFFHFNDPHGVRFEIALGMKDAKPFASDKLEHGFLTGDLGIGHAAFNSTDHLEDERFMRETLFAHLSDYIYQPMPDGSTMHASFLHTNPRHHSVAYAEGLGPPGVKLNHFQLEMNSILDVGRTYERMQAAGVGIAVTLGQHSNDRIVSFYAQTPSNFLIEIGCDGLTIDDETSWKPIVHDRISEWGHKFQAL